LAPPEASAVAFHSAVYGCDVCGRWEKALELMEALVQEQLEEQQRLMGMNEGMIV